MKPRPATALPRVPPARPAELDRAFVWHPFTVMREWGAPDADVTTIVRGRGAVLTDDRGHRYLDGNSSIWTNLHGHRHPRLDAAVRRQLGRIAHSSFLGLTHDAAPRLAAELVAALHAPERNYRVFFSDDGSTAMEAALKIAVQARAQRGEPRRNRFVTLGHAYHGDTVGAMSLGKSALFHRPFHSLLFDTVHVPAPHCYRCPDNRARVRAGMDARQARRCGWQCLERLRQALDDRSETVAAFVMEPRVQGAAGLWMHPPGFLRQAADLCRARGIWLLLDEVLTGFGRTGTFLACQQPDDAVLPDLLALAKGLTGGYLPLAATLVAGEIFAAFLGDFTEYKTFYHGHSYTANPLGCAAALANLEIFRQERVLARVRRLAEFLPAVTRRFWEHPHVGDVRHEGLIAGIELVEDVRLRRPFPVEARVGHRVCQAARRYGLLTRPIGDVLVLMPPYCVTRRQLTAMGEALWRGLNDVLP